MTPAGRRVLERMLRARRDWLERLLISWDDSDLSTLAALLSQFAEELDRDLEAVRA